VNSPPKQTYRPSGRADSLLVFFDDFRIAHRALEAVEAVDPLRDQSVLEVLGDGHVELVAVDDERPGLGRIAECGVEILFGLGVGVGGGAEVVADAALVGRSVGDILLGREEDTDQTRLDAVDEDQLLFVLDIDLAENDLADVRDLFERILLVEFVVVVGSDNLRDRDCRVVLQIEQEPRRRFVFRIDLFVVDSTDPVLPAFLRVELGRGLLIQTPTPAA